MADGELAARARLLNQPFRKHARTGPPARALQVGDDARRQGRHPHRATPSGSPARRRGRAATCGAPSATRSSVGIGTALADDPLLTARIEDAPRQPRRVVFDSEGRLPLDSQLVERRARGAADRRRLARGAAHRHRRAGGRRRRRHRRHGRERAGAHPLGARPARRRPASPRSCSRAGRTSRARSSTPARSTRSRSSSRPSCSAARRARDPLEGEGVERIAEATRALAMECRADRRRRADHGPNAGVVTMFTGLVMDLGDVAAVERTDDGVRLRVRTTLTSEIAPGDSVAINGVCLTATEVGEDGFSADVMNETLTRSSLAGVAEGGHVNVELPLRAERPPRRPLRAGARRRDRPRGRRARRTASPAACGSSRRRRDCCATWSRRARSRWTACR